VQPSKPGAEPSPVKPPVAPGAVTPRPAVAFDKAPQTAHTPGTPSTDPRRCISPVRMSRSQRSASCTPTVRSAVARAQSLVPPKPQPMSSAVLPPPLAIGQVVSIGPISFVVGCVLGEGTYARVWSARRAPINGSLPPPEEGGAEEDEVAIKEMRCGRGPGILPDATLQHTLYEVQVMKRLAALGSAQEIAAPRILSHQVWPLPASPGAFLCRMAMTRRKGQPLGEWLEAWTTRATASAGPGGSCKSTTYCASFLSAAGAMRRMLVQLTPTFARLNGNVAYHRDVNVRNLLVHPCSNDDRGLPCLKSLEFSVVDFGASMDMRAWAGNGEGSWQTENPTGDARY